MARDGQSFRWAVLGAGGVSRKFLLGLRALGGRASVTAVASRTPASAERFAAELGVPHVGTFEEIVARPDVDAVYVASPPSEHEAHALLAIHAGKPVLVEKPFAMDAAAARRIADAARDAHVFCMEAMWTRFQPLMTEVRRRVRAGEIGELRMFRGGFFGADEPDPKAIRYNPALGGGALMDRAVYPISLARDLLGPIEEVRAMARIGDTGVDEECALTLRHVSGALSIVSGSMRVFGENGASVHGTAGTIRIDPPIYRPMGAMISPTSPRKGDGGSGRMEALKEGGLVQGLYQRAGPVARLARRGGRRLSAPYAGNGYHYEAEALMDAVGQGLMESLVMPLDQSIEVMEVIDAARSDWTGANGRSSGGGRA